MSFEGGYTGAVNSATARAEREQAMQESMQRMALRDWLHQQEQSDRQRQDRARTGAGATLSSMYGGGVPNAPEGAPPGGPLDGVSPSMMQAFAPPPMPSGQGPMPPPPGQPSQPAPPPQGGMPPPGGGMGPPQGAGAPPGMSGPPGGGQAPPGPNFQPRPGGPLAGQQPPPQAGAGGMPPPPPGGPPGAAGPMQQPQQMGGQQGGGQPQGRIAQAIAQMKKMGVPDDQVADQLDQLRPILAFSDKEEIDGYKREQAGLKAALESYKATIAAYSAETKRSDADSRIGAREDRGAARTRELDMREAGTYGQSPRGRQKTAAAGGGAAGNGAAGPSPSLNDEDAKEARRIQAWNYINTKNLPYRKGTGGGADRNDSVMREVTSIARELNMGAQELMSQSADFKSNAQSLAFQTKKLDAIEGQLTSFHNNIESWDNIAKGLPPAAAKDWPKGLGKIDFSDVKTWNDIKFKIEAEFNDPAVAAYMVSTMAVAMDYARIMQGPQSIASLTEGARKDAERLISAGLNEKARKAVIGTLESDAAGQVKGIETQRDKIKGRLGMRAGDGDKGAGTVREFKSEAEAKAAGLKSGTKIKINGVSGEWRE